MNATSTAAPTESCPGCGEPIGAGARFCESCGAEIVDGIVSPTETGTRDPLATRVVAAPRAVAATCLLCAGTIDDDGFCSTCGARGRVWRDHWTEAPSTWVGGVCDIGIKHARNEDAMSLWASESPDPAAVLVVCDGVTTAPHSDRAALMASTDSVQHMTQAVNGGTSVAATVNAATDAIVAGCRIAQVAVLGVTRDLGNPPVTPSCTFAAAIVGNGVLAAGWCGDSRVYWLPDTGTARIVSRDHSMATILIDEGATRAEAEADPAAHTITRWLGADSVEPFPDTTTLPLDTPGWVLVCSDGLWNYVTEADDLRDLIDAAVSAGAVGPVAISESLAAVANDRGGHDNVTVALARIEIDQPGPPEPGLESEA